MTTWIILTLMACAVTVGLSIPLVRRYEAGVSKDAKASATLELQLAEVDRDLARGLLDEPTAEQARTDIRRRMLQLVRSHDAPRPLSSAWRSAILVGATAATTLLAVAVYARLGSPQLQTVTDMSGASTQPLAQAQSGAAAVDTVDSMITRLEQRLQASPNDADGWRMLGWSYFNTQRYADARKAYNKARALAPDNADYMASEAEAMVQEQAGLVTPEAAKLFADVLQRDPGNERARFYDALRLEQAGQLVPAFEAWSSLIASASPDAAWLAEAQRHAQDLASKTGQAAPPALPKLPSLSEGANAPPITAEDMNAVQSMPAEDQQAMIKSMVERLANRLAENDQDADGWIRLMRSRLVLQDAAGANEAFAKAAAAFKGNATELARITSAAQALGIATD
jgi:cytochrome c-type biogenesis protein CcmH